MTDLKNPVATFLNAASIQTYVFATNKLKHVIGASHIIKHIFEDFRKDIAGEGTPKGYIGGGNALIIFDSEETAKKRLRDFTKNTLLKYPGVVFKIGILNDFKVGGGETNEKTDYQKSMKSIIANAGVQLSVHYPITNLPKHGITSDCPYSDFSADKTTPEYGKKQFVSQNITAKLEPALWKNNESEDQELLKEAGLEGYCFAKEFDNMGQQKGIDSHIAIIHIDGNGIGKEFMNCKNLGETISLSKDTDDIVRKTFVSLLKELGTLIPTLSKLELMPKEKIKDENSQKILLPIRPILIGGDDITIVCNSFLGIWAAQRFMHFFSEVSKEKLGKSFTSCVGICITKTHYPFYRGYRLAEELCENAKTAAHKINGNWIDFHVAMTDIPDEVTNIRETQYKNAEGASLTMRPYWADVFSERLTQAIELKKLPNDWIKSLRSSIYAGKNECIQWKQKAQWREKDFPKVPGFDGIINNNTTPYYDLIELSEIVLPELYKTPKNV